MAESQGPHRGIPPSDDALSAVRVVFPTTEEEFKNDVRVSFDKLSEKWMLEEDNGDEYEWNPKFAKWVPALNDELLAQQQSIYAMKGVDESAPAVDTKKRKAEAKVYPHFLSFFPIPYSSYSPYLCVSFLIQDASIHFNRDALLHRIPQARLLVLT